MHALLFLGLFIVSSIALDCPVGYTVIESCHKIPQPTSQFNPTSSSQTITQPLDPKTQLNENNWLSMLNSLRKDHGAPPVVISKELLSNAQDIVKKCSLDSSSSSAFGQTAYKEYTQNPSNEQSFDQLLPKAISSWYKTIDNYDFANPQFTMQSGHATQLLWKSTTQIGCAIQLCTERTSRNMFTQPDYFYFLLCNFFPPGNVKGTFEQNVSKKVR